MEYYKKILRFAKPYLNYGYLNIFFNILYALFSALSFAALMPMLNVLFEKDKQLSVPPIYQGIRKLKDYFMEYMNYQVTQFAAEDKMKGLILVIGLLIVLFLLKNWQIISQCILLHFLEMVF